MVRGRRESPLCDEQTQRYATAGAAILPVLIDAAISACSFEPVARVPTQMVAQPLSVTAVIPCHNGARHLAQTLASIQAQQRPVRETIVVDDGSSDGSPELAEARGARCIRQAVAAGAATARNVGVAAARTDLVAFLDQDDLWTPDHLATLVPLLEDSGAAVAYGQMQAFEGSTQRLVRPGGDGVPFDPTLQLLAWNFVPQSGAVVRRDAFQAVGGYDEEPEFRYAEDYALWLRLAERYRFVGSSRVTTLYRVHEGQRSGDVRAMVEGEWAVRARHARRAAEADPARGALTRRRLLAAWRAELRQAWRERNTALFAARLAAAPQVPHSGATHRRWALAARLLGALWLPPGGGGPIR